MQPSLVRRGLFSRLFSFGNSSGRVVGYDLQGNKYIELPPPEEGYNTKRVVEYAGPARNPADYARNHALPPQWTAWMTHTRREPPTIEELQHDANRRAVLAGRVAALEARDAEEQQRQRLAALSRPAYSPESGAVESGELAKTFLSSPAAAAGDQTRSTTSSLAGAAYAAAASSPTAGSMSSSDPESRRWTGSTLETQPSPNPPPLPTPVPAPRSGQAPLTPETEALRRASQEALMGSEEQRKFEARRKQEEEEARREQERLFRPASSRGSGPEAVRNPAKTGPAGEWKPEGWNPAVRKRSQRER